jgi:hypothetical protein
MKGQQEAISIVIISGILIGVVGSVYFWGVPLIQKNKDIAMLENSENFVRSLSSKIKFIANNGGRDQVGMEIPGIVRFDPASNAIEIAVNSEGTIYAINSPIPLGKNIECGITFGAFGIHNPETICVTSSKISENKYRTTYSLRYIKLGNQELGKNFIINMTGAPGTGGQDSTIIFDNKGNTETQDSDGRKLISTVIEISIV